MDGTKTIFLSRGRVAIVDEADYERVTRFKWSLRINVDRSGKRREYAYRSEHEGTKATTIYLHRFVTQATPDQFIDHKNHNGLDNRQSNLRFCTNSQNIANSAIRLQKKTSQFKGVSWRKSHKRWVAYIRHNGCRKHLGLFADEQQAAFAYNSAATKLFGEFANLNSINKEVVL